jgi:MFS family permease
MGVGNLLKESLGLTRKHIIIIAPPVIVSFIVGGLSIVVIGMRMTAMEPDVMGKLGEGMPDLIYVKSVLSIVGWVFYGFAQGMVASMMIELEDKGQTSIGFGFGRANEMIISLMVSGFIIGAFLLLGFIFMLFIIPGLIVAFIFIFTFVVIMFEKRGPIDAMKRSVQIVRSNLSDTFKLFAAIIGIGFFLMFFSVILSKLSLIGILSSMALTGAYMGYTYVVFVKAYQKFKEEGAGFPQG